MMTMKRDIPTFVCPDGALDEAIGWLRSEVRPGERALVLPPLKDTSHLHSRGDEMRRLSRWADIESERTLPKARWVGGPLLALWPSEPTLAKVERDSRVRALCVVEWLPGDCDQWLRERSVTSVLRPIPVSTLGDHAVTFAMMMLTDAYMVSGDIDRAFTVRALECLRDAGCSIDETALFSWAVMNGWSERASVSLREYAIGIPKSRYYSIPGKAIPPSSARELVARWRRHGEVIAKSDEQ